jgi:formate hydrogenlyase transcriptional activator
VLESLESLSLAFGCKTRSVQCKISVVLNRHPFAGWLSIRTTVSLSVPAADADHELFRILVEGTAAASGDKFFQSLVKHLTAALGVRFAFVAEFSDATSTVRTLAFWSGEHLRDNIEYELAGTPCEEVIRGGICHHPDNVTQTFPNDTALSELNAASYLGVPLRDEDGAVLGHLAVMDDRPMPEEPRNLAVFHIFATRVRTEMLRLRAEQQLEQANERLEGQVALRTKELREALDEVERLKNRLQAENLYLQDEIKVEHDFEEIIGGSSTLKAVLGQVEQVAVTTATVLILGESGTGKELLARAIHNLSDRRDRPLVKVNCAALPGNLIESELFGHEKGSFTGAFAKKIGRFELANGGTIFLDEIGELPLELQVKLLRVLQEQEFERIGGSQTISVDSRVIAATNRDLKRSAASGEFREDLFYRLNVFPVLLPPLRQRTDDIPLLARAFTERFAKRLGKKIDSIPQDVIEAFQTYRWPGNIRELQNVIERAVILTRGSVLHVDEPLDEAAAETAPLAHVKSTLEEVERRHITRTLDEANWKISGEGGAAQVLDMNPSTLRARMRKLGIKRS